MDKTLKNYSLPLLIFYSSNHNNSVYFQKHAIQT